MMPEGLALAAAFLGLAAAPLLPGLVELRRGRDAAPLALDPGPLGPERLGRALRDELRPVVAAVTTTPREVHLGARRPTVVHVHDTLHVPSRHRIPGVLVARGVLEAGEACHLDYLWGQQDVRLGRETRITALASDGNVVLDPGTVVESWLDGRGTVRVGSGARLGQVATDGELAIATRVRFARLLGTPVVTAGASRPPVAVARNRRLPAIDDRMVWARRSLALPRHAVLDHDIVVHGDLRVGARAVVRGDIKAHGQVVVGEGARLDGNLVSRGHVRLGAGVRLAGHLFAEGHAHLAAGVEVGSRDAPKSVVALRTLSLGPDVRVFGWLVAADGRVS